MKLSIVRQMVLLFLTACGKQIDDFVKVGKEGNRKHIAFSLSDETVVFISLILCVTVSVCWYFLCSEGRPKMNLIVPGTEYESP